VASRIQREESGRGIIADRVKISFVKHLKELFFEYTNKKPSRSPKGLFRQFVVSVNELIPNSSRIPAASIDHLIAVATF
jgi:hypothetical protein